MKFVTHYAVKFVGVRPACARNRNLPLPAPDVLMATNPQLVDCGLCKRTTRYKKAAQRAGL